VELESIRVLAKECGIAFEVIQDDCSYVDAASPMLVITAGTVEYEELLASSADLRLFQEDVASNQPHSIATQEFQSGLLSLDPLRNNAQFSSGYTGGQKNQRHGSEHYGYASPDASVNTDASYSLLKLGSSLLCLTGCNYPALKARFIPKDNLEGEIPEPLWMGTHPNPNNIHLKERMAMKFLVTMKHTQFDGQQFTHPDKKSRCVIASSMTNATCIVGLERVDGKACSKTDYQEFNIGNIAAHSDVKNSDNFSDLVSLSYVSLCFQTKHEVKYRVFYRNTYLWFDRKSIDDACNNLMLLRPVVERCQEYKQGIITNVDEKYRFAEDPNDYIEHCGRNGLVVLVDRRIGKFHFVLL
jgi:hypothetical protein